jgi:hypothetical protein
MMDASSAARLTMPDARSQNITDSGKARIYRTLPVKFKRRKILPATPHASEQAFSAISLGPAG